MTEHESTRILTREEHIAEYRAAMARGDLKAAAYHYDFGVALPEFEAEICGRRLTLAGTKCWLEIGHEIGHEGDCYGGGVAQRRQR